MNVRFGSEADISGCPLNIRPKADVAERDLNRSTIEKTDHWQGLLLRTRRNSMRKQK